MSKVPRSLFTGTDELISGFLGLSDSESLRQKSFRERLKEPPGESPNFGQLISALYRQISHNRTDHPPSRENWRINRQIVIGDENRSPEVLLERAVANLGERGVLKDWYNQIPVASGLVNANADKRRAVDLMRYADEGVVLVELKWESDTPAFAAFEILRYGLAFLFTYVHQNDLGYSEKPLMGVEKASLWVLAPHVFYSGYDLAWLGAGLCEGVGAVAEAETGGNLSMDFGFRVFPADFRLPFGSGADVLLGTQVDTVGGRAVMSAIRGIEPIWEKPVDAER